MAKNHLASKKFDGKVRGGASGRSWLLYCGVLAAVGFCALFRCAPFIEAVASGWSQSDWSGGSDAGVVATHTSDRTTWTKYAAKSDNVAAGAESTALSQPTGSFVHTSAADFGGDALEADMLVDAASGALTLKRANGRPCSGDEECLEAYCLGDVCTENLFIYGVCSGVGISPADAPSTLQWKTANNKCLSPQCVSGQLLVSDPSVDFSSYPAQQYCLSLGTRLPTRSELDCLFTNRNAIGGFSVAKYWSNEGIVSSYWYNAYAKNFDPTTGGQWLSDPKPNYYRVRCVRDQG